ncbi:hypothetical protein NDU88_006414 [Pleurodeles waltl]|uniref:SAP domain-containing protein n=1 Tax=Pleurodeles waltl TaxID=8319 RepID=A0AAV7WEN7_PLEWA|nr:hypothetical protein NDU88_006414 [Pleurodeles waltl]
MSLAWSQAGDEDFDLAMLETCTVKQLKGFCKDMGVPTHGASRKEEIQIALKAWAEAQSEEEVEEEGPEDGPSEGFLPSVEDVTTVIVPSVKPGSSVSDSGLTAVESSEREFRLQLAKLNMEAEERKAQRATEERRAEAAAERALAEKKLLLAHELSLKELDIKARQSESSSDGFSIHAGPVGEKTVHIPKSVVPSYVVGDDIEMWLAAYEVALRAHGISEEQWGAALWFYVPAVGRDTFLTLDPHDQNVYAPMKAALLAKFEKYHQRFRDSTKLSTQTWVGCFDFSNKALNGWVRGSKLNDYKELYDLILREHMLKICFRVAPALS